MQKLRERIVTQTIFAQCGSSANIEIVVRERQISGAEIGEQTAIAVESGIEAVFEHLFRLGRRYTEREDFQRPDLRDQPEEKGQNFFTAIRLTVALAPTLLIARARQIIEKLVTSHSGQVSLDVALLDLPRNFARFRDGLAHIVTIRGERLVFMLQNRTQIQSVRFLERLVQERLRDLEPDEIVVGVRGVTLLRYFQDVESKLGLHVRQRMIFVGHHVAVLL